MTQATADAPLDWDPYDYELLRAPFAAFKRLRDEAPLYYNEKHDFYAMSRFADCQEGLSDNATFISGKGVIMEMIKAQLPTPPGFFISEDPPIHTVHRNLLAQAFTAPRMARLEHQIRDFCARTLDPLVGAGRFDLIRDFAAVVPMRVIGMLLGIPEEFQEEVRRQADARLRTEIGKPMEVNPYETDELFQQFIALRLKSRSEDLMSELIYTEFEDETGTRRTLTLDEVGNIVQMLAAAGNETTNKLIGWSGKLLAENPDQRRAIVENRDLIIPAIEEVLRFEPPADHIGRYVARDFEAYGTKVPEGSVMIFLTGAANRDERQFNDPETFDIHRERKLHLTFGYGPHLCIGAALARIEGRIALDEMLSRFPDWEIDEAEARMIPTSSVRGWDTLPVVTH
jgi:cytochrome P450